MTDSDPLSFFSQVIRFITLMALDEWSDSDDEVLSDVETSVLLGVPDGPLETIADINDAAVSRIGGHPVRSISRMY